MLRRHWNQAEIGPASAPMPGIGAQPDGACAVVFIVAPPARAEERLFYLLCSHCPVLGPEGDSCQARSHPHQLPTHLRHVRATPDGRLQHLASQALTCIKNGAGLTARRVEVIALADRVDDAKAILADQGRQDEWRDIDADDQ